jgi:hypothetical protein
MIDANMPGSAIGALEAQGHQVGFARNIGRGSALDARLRSASVRPEMRFSHAIWTLPTSGNTRSDRYGGIVALSLADHFAAAEIIAVLGRFWLSRGF